MRHRADRAGWPAEELLAENLAALHQRDAALADALTAVAIPNTAELVTARDGSATYRLRQPDGRRQWLGYSSMPLISAGANARRMKIGAGNMAMNGLGHGAEAEMILAGLGLHQASWSLSRMRFG